MIEAFSIPILLKATTFLFEEASKILRERRERRQAEQKNAEGKDDNTPASSKDAAKSEDAITSKDVALNQKIEKIAWLGLEAEIEHLVSLLEVNTRNYHLAKEQYAKWGSALVPPIIVNNLAEAEDEIAKTSKQLQAALSRVYGKEINAPEVE